jgi:hypothetical protein
VSREKRNKVTVTGIFRHDLSGIDLLTSKWVDPNHMAKDVGIDENHTVRARITVEVIEGQCELCGTPATGYQTCQRCGILVCDKCAKTYLARRYCPTCFDKTKLSQEQV